MGTPGKIYFYLLFFISNPSGEADRWKSNLNARGKSWYLYCNSERNFFDFYWLDGFVVDHASLSIIPFLRGLVAFYDFLLLPCRLIFLRVFARALFARWFLPLGVGTSQVNAFTGPLFVWWRRFLKTWPWRRSFSGHRHIMWSRKYACSEQKVPNCL